MSKIKDFILEQVVPGFHARRANTKVSKFYKDRESFEVDITEVKGNENIYIEQVKADLKEQHDRKKIIEDKAKSLLFIITVSITAITFSLTYLNSITYDIPQIIALFFLGVSILYFVQGVIKALQTLNIRQFHVIQAEVEITDENYKLSSKKADPEFLKELIKSKQQNDLINLRLSNYTFASFNLIRNGIIFFIMFFASTIFGNYFSQREKSKDAYVIKKEIKTIINDTTSLTIPYSFELKYDIKDLKIDKEDKK